MTVSLASSPDHDRVMGILALLRGEVSPQALAERFGVPVTKIKEWETDFIAGGTRMLKMVPEEQPRTIDLAALHAISQSLAAILDLDDLIAATIDNLHWVFGYIPSIGLVEGTSLVLKGGYSITGNRIDWQNQRLPIADADRNIMVWVAANGRLLNIQDTANDPRYTHDPLVGQVRSELAMPIIYKGTILGVLDIRAQGPNVFHQGDVSVLETVAVQLAIAVENAQLFETVRRRVAQLELVQSVTAKAIEDLDVQAILSYTVQVTREILGYSSVAVGLISDDQQTVALTALATTNKNTTTPDLLEVPIRETTIFGAAILSNTMVLENNGNFTLESLIPASRSMLALPIRSRGVPIGVLVVESEIPTAFDDTDISTMTILADQLTISIQGARLFQQTQAHLREISLFRRLADEAIVGILTRDTAGVIEYANTASALLLGYPDPTELRGVSVQSLYPNDTWYKIDQELCIQAYRDGGWSGEVRMYCRRDNREFTADISIFPIHTSYDSFIAYGMVIQDATERHRLLEETQRTKARLEAILQATDDAVILWDDQWTVLLVNPAASALLGMPTERLVGTQRSDWANNPVLSMVANAHENERIEFSGEKRRVARYRNLQWKADLGGSGHLTILYDITSQVELESTREDMMTMLVHDLRSPLNSVLGGIEAAQTILDENGTWESAKRYLEKATRNGNMLLDTANSLLDITKFEAGRIALDYAPLSAPKMIADVVGIVATAAQQAGITINTAIEDNLPTLLADNGLIRRAISNLLDNAVKFTPDGGQITISAHREDTDKIRFSVADTGPGVPEAFRRKIFDKYGQVPDQNGRSRGTGLGLALCRLVAEVHHGRIWVEGRSEGGSVFHMVIAGGTSEP